ncbi:MAG: response regulator, partial [Angelakisella sp.]
MYKFLVVDDEPLTREYMRAILPTFFAVPEQVMLFEAEDGIAASELLAVTSIDIVITDIRMPGMDGMQLAELIHNRYQNTFVMLLSGYEEFSYAHSAIQFGVMDYLLKPIVKEELYEAILR